MTRHESFDTLRLLEERVRADLELTNYPSRPWLPAILAPDGRPASDVIVIGGGQSGISAAFGLMREQLQRVRVVDRAIEGYEGPWATFARMTTLRTPKHVLGPDLGMPRSPSAPGIPLASARTRGRDLKRVPRLAWMEYLRWLRRVLAIPIENGRNARGLSDPAPPIPASSKSRCVTATGSRPRMRAASCSPRGSTGPAPGRCHRCWGPAARALVPHLRRHRLRSPEGPPHRHPRGRRLGLRQRRHRARGGAASVDLFYRRARLPRVNPYRWMENAGFLAHFADMRMSGSGGSTAA